MAAGGCGPSGMERIQAAERESVPRNGEGMGMGKGMAKCSSAPRRPRRQTIVGQKLNEDVLAWYLKTSKLALALAVISDTPPEKSSREYAEHLAKTLSVKEVDWKVKAETWKTEVLRLRQELFLSRMKSIAGTSNGADSAFCPEFPTRGALESRNESTHLEDSGCDLSNGQESDTQDLLANHSLGYLDSYSLTNSLLMETTWTLVHLLHGGKLPKIILVQCIKIVEELVKDLVKVILDNTKVNRRPIAEKTWDIPAHCVTDMLPAV
ncbi:hypothetical protein chiPu_0008089 [Chiloscyllium punctatum]|uniref:Uncharacterized protein n=1 Tax=Chiloscyllium punctatum TaxID=137246 RepID=A0A401SGV8_CHIPU|nr:hypothetical protein [Chiloscyllium punctatum]